MRVAFDHLHVRPHPVLLGLMGLGDCVSDGTCGDLTAHDSGIYDSLPSSRAYTAPTANAATITLPGTSITGQYLTLESHMEQWAQNNTSGLLSPSSVAVTDPSQFPAIALQEAQTYCAGYPVPDCGDADSIAGKFGNLLKDAWSYFPSSVWAAVKAAGSSSGIPGAVMASYTPQTIAQAQVGNQVTVPELGINYSLTNPAQAVQQFNQQVATLPVPTSQSAQPTASQLRSSTAGSLSSDFAAIGSDLSSALSGGSIPTWVWLAGAGVLAMMFLGGSR